MVRPLDPPNLIIDNIKNDLVDINDVEKDETEKLVTKGDVSRKTKVAEKGTENK